MLLIGLLAIHASVLILYLRNSCGARLAVDFTRIYHFRIALRRTIEMLEIRRGYTSEYRRRICVLRVRMI